MTESNPAQNEQNNTELQEKQQLKNAILKICEPMCIKLIKDKPQNITSYMINYLQNKYNYSSSLLRNDEKKELQKLKDDIEIFHDMDEHYYFVEQQNKLKKETKVVEKKSKIPPKPKPRLPPEEIIPSDDEDYNNPDEIDPRLDNPNFISSNLRVDPRPGTFENFTKNYQEVKYSLYDKPPQLFDFIKINLMKSPLFSELSLDALKKCIDAMEEKNFVSMNEIVKQGDYSNTFYFIAEGELECRMGFTKIIREGNKKRIEKYDPKLVKVYYPGDYFGELNLLYHIPIRGTVKAITDTKIYILDRYIYKQILNNSFKGKNERRILLFKNIPILQTLNDEELERLVQISKEAIYYKDEIIIKENEYQNTLMILEEGNCFETKIVEEGKKAKKTKDHREGFYFGEEALLKPEKRQESIIANSDVVRFICIDRYTFKNIFGSLEQILMRNMEVYTKYFPPLPEIKEEKPFKIEEENVNPDNIQPVNPIEPNNGAIVNVNNSPENNEDNIKINPNISIDELTQKFNKEKEELKEQYENNIKMLTDKINSLENELKNNKNNINNDYNISNNKNNNNSNIDNNNNMNSINNNNFNNSNIENNNMNNNSINNNSIKNSNIDNNNNMNTINNNSIKNSNIDNNNNNNMNSINNNNYNNSNIDNNNNMNSINNNNFNNSNIDNNMNNNSINNKSIKNSNIDNNNMNNNSLNNNNFNNNIIDNNNNMNNNSLNNNGIINSNIDTNNNMNNNTLNNNAIKNSNIDIINENPNVNMNNMNNNDISNDDVINKFKNKNINNNTNININENNNNGIENINNINNMNNSNNNIDNNINNNNNYNNGINISENNIYNSNNMNNNINNNYNNFENNLGNDNNGLNNNNNITDSTNNNNLNLINNYNNINNNNMNVVPNNNNNNTNSINNNNNNDNNINGSINQYPIVNNTPNNNLNNQNNEGETKISLIKNGIISEDDFNKKEEEEEKKNNLEPIKEAQNEKGSNQSQHENNDIFPSKGSIGENI